MPADSPFRHARLRVTNAWTTRSTGSRASVGFEALERGLDGSVHRKQIPNADDRERPTRHSFASGGSNVRALSRAGRGLTAPASKMHSAPWYSFDTDTGRAAVARLTRPSAEIMLRGA
jgi:hypothetical protein